MSQIAKQGILTTLASYLGVVIGYFNVLWLYPFALEPEQIGTFRTIQDIAILLVPFAQVGLSNGLTKFFPKVSHQPGTFLTLSLLFTIGGFIVIVFGFFVFQDQIVWTFQQNSPEIIPFLNLILFITLFGVLNSILDAYSRSYYLIAFPTFIREVILRLFLSILVSIYLLEIINFETLMYGLIGVYSSALLSMIFYLMHKNILRISFKFNSLPKGFIKKLMTYSSITFLGTAGALLIAKIDSIMVSAMIGLEANAIYIIGYSIALVIEMPRRAISQTISPVIASHFENKKSIEIQNLYQNIAVHQLLICALLFLGIWSNVNNVYEFIPNNELYEAGKWVIFWIGMGKLTDILFSINGEILVFSKHYKFNVWATVFMFLAIVGLNYLFIPIYGLVGAAFASFLSMLLFNVIKYSYLKIKLNMDPFTWPLLKIALLTLLTYYIQASLMGILPEYSPIVDLFLRSVLIVLIYFLGIYFLKLIPDSTKKWIKKIRFGS
jgi:O-antigen/teichoic acid export membrane protein